MSATLFNPTNEVLKGMYIGLDFVIKPGQKIRVDDAKANHLLINNELVKRGLCVLDYVEPEDAKEYEEKIARQGIARNIEFKEKQIVRYNQRNESRKMTGKTYLPATNLVKNYAIELGIELNKPYDVRDAEKMAISQTQSENADLKNQVAALNDKLNKLMDHMSAGQEAKKEVVEEETEVIEEPEAPIKRGRGRPRNV